LNAKNDEVVKLRNLIPILIPCLPQTLTVASEFMPPSKNISYNIPPLVGHRKPTPTKPWALQMYNVAIHILY
jgi:hypothetical protein